MRATLYGSPGSHPAMSAELTTTRRIARALEAARPAGTHAVRVCPEYPGRFAPVIPEEWMPL